MGAKSTVRHHFTLAAPATGVLQGGLAGLGRYADDCIGGGRGWHQILQGPPAGWGRHDQAIGVAWTAFNVRYARHAHPV